MKPMTHMTKQMKRFVTLLVLLLAVYVPTVGTAQEAVQSVKLLTVGNSLADNATAYLPDFANAAGNKLVIFKANLGGHSLEQHAGYAKAYEANHDDPKGHAYKGKIDPKTGQKHDFSLGEALQSDQWDYVTIQQVSGKSYLLETYEPYAQILIDCIHRYAPKAKIMVLETWAYREDCDLFTSGTLNQEKMHSGIKTAYGTIAAKYGLDILPAGDAFQTARNTDRWRFVPDTKYDFSNAPKDVLPAVKGGLNAGWKWAVDTKTGKQRLSLDYKHCNTAGKFLGAAVLYDKLFNNVEANTFCPPDLAPEDAAMLRRIAHEAVLAQAAAPKPEATGTR